MNTKQQYLFSTGLLVMLVMGAFPPIAVETFRPPWTIGFNEEVPALSNEYHYRFILDSAPIVVNDTGISSLGSNVGWRRLQLQWLIVFLVTLVLMTIFRNRRDEGGGDISSADPTDSTPPIGSHWHDAIEPSAHIAMCASRPFPFKIIHR